MRMPLTAAACLLLLGAAGMPAHAQSVGEKTGVNSLIGVAPSAQDFVTQAVISDMFEDQTSKLALEKADDKTKAFAKKMIEDHKKTSDELKSVVQTGDMKLTLPTALDSSHQSKLDKLKSLSGEDFTKQYHDDQVTAHKNATDLYKRYAEGGDNAALKAFAIKTKPHLDEHLKTAQDLDSKK
jgi:putative membrane protein